MPVTDLPLSVLTGLDEKLIGNLNAVGRVHRFRRGELILQQGERSDHALLIRRGTAKISVLSAGGYETLLGIRGPGDVVGEAAAIVGPPRTATVRALVAVEALAVPADAFRAFLEEHPRVLFGLVGELILRLREADRRRGQYGSYGVPERLGLLLHELMQSHGRPGNGGTTIDLPLSQQDLAGAIGCSREAITKALRVLRETGAIRTARQRVTILRTDLLVRGEQ